MMSEHVARVRDRVEAACQRAGRSPEEVCIVAVAKNRTSQEIQEVISVGITDIAENRVQEAIAKFSNRTSNLEPRTSGVKLHMIGHLQTNKVKDAVALFDLIHSVDSVRLARELDTYAARLGKVQDILMQVNTSAEATKSGVSADAAEGTFAAIAPLRHVRVRGLMTIAPIVGDPEKARPFFKKLRLLRDELVNLRTSNLELRVLSMGMSDDFEGAIEEGATIIRIGRAIFEG